MRLLYPIITILLFQSFSFSQDNCNRIDVLNKTIEKHHINGLLSRKDILIRSLKLTLETLDPWANIFLKEEVRTISKKQSYCERYKSIKYLYENGIARYSSILDSIDLDYAPFLEDSVLLNPLNKTQKFRESVEELVYKIARDIYYLSLVDYSADTTLNSFESNWEYLKNTAIDYEKCRISRFLNKENHVLNVYLNAIASSHDPHTNFFDASTLQEFYNDLSTEILTTGIIADHDLNGDVRIYDIMPGSSAESIGTLSVGDKITKIKIEGVFQSASCLDSNQLLSLFNSGDNSSVDLIIQKQNGQFDEVIVEKAITNNDINNIITAISKTKSGNLGYLYFNSFYVDEFTNVSNDLASKLLKLNENGIEGLVIDLRFNGGGDIGNAISLIGSFVDFGPLFVHVDNNYNPYTFRDYNRGKLFDGPLIILVNFASASASEIFASALRNRQSAIIVGETTYGKASGQNVTPLFEGNDEEPFGFLKLTTSRYYEISSGLTHQNKGIKPDISVGSSIPGDLFSEFREDFSLKNDTLSTSQKGNQRIDYIDHLALISQERLKTDTSYLNILNRQLSARALLENGFYMKLSPEKFKNRYKKNNKSFSVFNDSINFRNYEIISGKIADSQNELLKKHLNTDHQLHETFNILEDWIITIANEN